MHARAYSYAQPLFSLCVENDITHEMLYDIKNLSSIDDQEIINVMRYPIISKQEKREMIDALSKANMGEDGFRQEFINLLKLLIDFDDIHLLSDIRKAYTELYQQKYGVEVIKVTFSKEPSSERLDQVRVLLENQLGPDKFVVIQRRIDPSLIGGIVIEFDGKVMDNSVKRHLKQLINNL
ncbi:ATP synthase F1 subunit delta [Mollicutes bacterium LVI A0078]|nr:ATP synthase F1 subunit delta [Mollicutes bacterium LVI A0075]WOO90598.1 ATP synthase F1 subunit delta [Mollicutes bacterium LVI A0078]